MELQAIYNADQSDRKSGFVGGELIVRNDSLRRSRVNELIYSGLVRTANDYHNAAMIFQHGHDTIASSMAVKLMKRSVELDPSINKWLLAAAIDKNLMYRSRPQIYGTQYTKSAESGDWELYKMDTTIVTDQERIEHGIKPLKELRSEAESYRKMRFIEQDPL